jgi:glycosyltransferase involved in cell wall biosynthesis
MPRVSVVIPIFNCERYLAQAIQSVRSQLFDDFELLLLNDGSEDRSAEMAAQAARNDRRIVFVNGEHRGVVYQRNLGMELATAEFVAMMDSDDISLPDRLAHQVRFLESCPDCVAVGTQAIRIDCDGFPVSEWRVPEQHHQIDHDLMEGRGGTMINPSVMIRKGAARQVGGYRTGFEFGAEDYDLFLRLAEIGQLANLPRALLQYRLHAKSMTFTYAEAQRTMTRQALKEAWGRRKRLGPLPPPLLDLRAPSEEELMWDWARTAFAAGNFRAARNQATKLLRRRPSDISRWVLFSAAWLGPLAFHLRRFCSYRAGSYRPPTEQFSVNGPPAKGTVSRAGTKGPSPSYET